GLATVVPPKGRPPRPQVTGHPVVIEVMTLAGHALEGAEPGLQRARQRRGAAPGLLQPVEIDGGAARLRLEGDGGSDGRGVHERGPPVVRSSIRRSTISRIYVRDAMTTNACSRRCSSQEFAEAGRAHAATRHSWN